MGHSPAPAPAQPSRAACILCCSCSCTGALASLQGQHCWGCSSWQLPAHQHCRAFPLSLNILFSSTGMRHRALSSGFSARDPAEHSRACGSLVGASFHPLPAPGEASALGNAEGADGVEFLKVKMLFKGVGFFSPINCSETVLKKWVRTEQGTGILLFWLQGLCVLINYQKGLCPSQSPALRGAGTATPPCHCHLWLSLFTHPCFGSSPSEEK